MACHGERKKEAKLDLSVYSSVAAVVKDHRVWERVAERLEAEEMPPEEATAAAQGARAPGGHRMDRGAARARERDGMRAIRARCWRGG